MTKRNYDHLPSHSEFIERYKACYDPACTDTVFPSYFDAERIVGQMHPQWNDDAVFAKKYPSEPTVQRTFVRIPVPEDWKKGKRGMDHIIGYTRAIPFPIWQTLFEYNPLPLVHDFAYPTSPIELMNDEYKTKIFSIPNVLDLFVDDYAKIKPIPRCHPKVRESFERIIKKNNIIASRVMLYF